MRRHRVAILLLLKCVVYALNIGTRLYVALKVL